MALSPDGATLYLFSGSIGGRPVNELTLALDTRTMTVAATIPVWTSWAGFRPDANEALLGNNLEYTVVDGAALHTVRSARLPDSDGVDTVVAFAAGPGGSLIALAPNTAARIRLVDAATQVETAALTIDATAYEMAFSPDGRSLYATTKAGTLVVIDTSAVVR
jgi:hypothetical protein